MINRKVQAVDSLDVKGAEKIWRFCEDTVVVLVDLERGIQCTVDTGFRLVRHGFFWRAESFGMMVTRLAWMAHKLVSSNK